MSHKSSLPQLAKSVSMALIPDTSFSFLDYTPVHGTTGTFQHTDNFYRVSLGLLYSFRPQLQIGPLYEFSAGSGPDPNTSQNYTRHVIMLRLVAKQ
jgi:hypothetical protein